MDAVVELIDRVLMNIDDPTIVEKTGSSVRDLMDSFPLYPELGFQ
jgi:glycine/serine hydroxymethyltransferase